jgi:hypothetical protein
VQDSSRCSRLVWAAATPRWKGWGLEFRCQISVTNGGASRRGSVHAENHDRNIVRLPPAAVDH